MDEVTQYARDILVDRITAGKYTRLACERHMNDLKRQGTEDFPYIFDYEKAEKVFYFFTFLRHVKGHLAGEPIYLDPFQKFILGNIFGWVHKDTGFRRFQRAYIQVARKNAKSTTLSGIGLYMLVADDEEGAEIYATATKKEQARIVYDSARVMASRSPDLLKRVEPKRDGTYHQKSNSEFKPLSKDTKSLDGLNPHLGIIDEYHAHPTSEMYDVIVSGMGQRTQPLLFIITTAGFDLTRPCYEEYTYCCKVLEGVLENEEYFIYIAQLDKDDDYKDESNWIKANPLLAQTEAGMDYLRSEFKIAQDVPSKMRTFLTKNLNVWVDQKDDGYMPMEKWKSCENMLPDLKKQECYVGVDLSAKLDLTSISFEFPLGDGRFVILSHSFMPEDTLAEKRRTDKVPYDLWVQQGWITATDGAVVDYRYIMKYIQDLIFENGWIVKEICYDQWNATQFAQEMEDEGFVCVEIPQKIGHLSEPTKDFQERVMQKKIIHNGNPVLNWAMSNAVVREDYNRNIMLDKKKARERIDPVAAVINSHVRAIVVSKTQRSVYEERGIRRL